MWESPIQIMTNNIIKDIEQKQDELLMESIRRVGFNIDKDELIKALKYDRDQYEKGYADGRRARDSEIVRCRDCIHGIPSSYDLRTMKASDVLYCTRYRMCHFEDYYCADGKRKETEDEYT